MQRYLRNFALAILAFGIAGQASPQVQISDVIEVLGRVTTATRPVENALVIALNLSNYTSTQTITDPRGEFRLPPLRSGIYRVIAVKRGFAPSAATVLPGRRAQNVTIELQSQSVAADSASEIWAIRSSIPSDVLRELNYVDPEVEIEQSPQRFSAQMASMTGVSDAESDRVVARTSVGVKGDLGRGWLLDFSGRVAQVGDGQLSASAGGESASVDMAIRSSERESYRLSSTRSSWRTPAFDPIEHATDLETHNFLWQREDATVGVHYLGQQNLYRMGESSELFEVSGEKTFFRTSSGQMGVAVRVAQENRAAGSDTPMFYRAADVVTDGQFRPASAFVIRYGVNARFATHGAEWAPHSTAEFKVMKDASLIVSALRKVFSERTGSAPPTLVIWNQTGNVSPKYSYSIGILTGNPEHGSFNAMASVSAFDSSVRFVFDDRFEEFWEGLDVEPGDIRRDLSLAYQKSLWSKKLSVGVETSVGTAVSESDTGAPVRSYLAGTVQSFFKPSGTSLDISYRRVEGKIAEARVPDYATRRLNIQMGQSLHLPLDLRVLLGLELATHAYPLAPDAEMQKRFLGGVSLAF